jgi:DNA-binding winged helix-turn-helix (wHTH) protein
VNFQFGPFRLDEPARSLRLRDRELSLQPRVFDLLVFLIRNSARVVSKDELLDTLWPGVTVTDNSLQRAVSALRAVLREGGMEDAVRNIPRSGYRFCADATSADQGASEPASGDSPRPLRIINAAMRSRLTRATSSHGRWPCSAPASPPTRSRY